MNDSDWGATMSNTPSVEVSWRDFLAAVAETLRWVLVTLALFYFTFGLGALFAYIVTA